MKTLKRNEEYKRVPDFKKRDWENIDKLVDNGWEFAPKKEWKNWKAESEPKKDTSKKSKRGKDRK